MKHFKAEKRTYSLLKLPKFPRLEGRDPPSRLSSKTLKMQFNLESIYYYKFFVQLDRFVHHDLQSFKSRNITNFLRNWTTKTVPQK